MMNNDHISVQFSHQEKWEIQKVIRLILSNSQGKYRDSKSLSEKFKDDIVQYVQQSKRKIQDYGRSIQWMKDLFIQKKVYPKRGKDSNYQMKKDEVYDCIKKLKTLYNQKDRDSECYSIYSNVVSELSSFSSQKQSSLQNNINKVYKVMNYQQRDNISKVANNLVKAKESEKKLQDIQQISSFLTKISRYGTNEEYPQLSKIGNEEVRSKVIKLVEQLKDNYVEIQPIYYYREQSIKDFINRLSNNLYSKQEMKKRMKYLNTKVQTLFQPLFNELYRLRQISQSSQRSMQYSQSQRTLSSNIDRFSQQDGVSQVISDLADYKKKNDELQNELKSIKWFISIVNYKGASDDPEIVKEVRSFIGKYRGEDIGRQLEKIYEKKKEEPKELAFKKKSKIYQQNLQDQKLNNEIFLLKAELKNLKEENQTLNQKIYQNIDQRIQLINRIQSLQSLRTDAQQSKLKNEQQYEQKIQNMQTNLLQINKKYNDNQSEVQTLRFSNNELAMLLQDRQKETGKVKQQSLLYEKTIVDLQNQYASKVIEQESLNDKNNKIQELQQLVWEHQAKIKQKDYKISELQTQHQQKIQKIQQQTDYNLQQQRQSKEQQINNLLIKISQLQNIQHPDESVELSSQVLQLATRNEQLASQFQTVISAKEMVLKSNVRMAQEKERVEIELNDVKEKYYQLNLQKEDLENKIKQHQLQLLQTKTHHQQLIVNNMKLQQKGKQYLQSNIALKRQINQLKANQMLQKDMSKSNNKGISLQQYKQMQNEMIQMNKITLMIRDQYKKYKQEMNNVVRYKVQIQKSVFKATQKKMRDNYQQLNDAYVMFKDKMVVLQRQNQKMKQEMNSMGKVQTNNLVFQQQQQQNDDRYEQQIRQYQNLTKQYQNLSQQNQQLLLQKKQNDRKLIQKQQQIQQIKLQQLQHINQQQQTQNLVHENTILQERLKYMQEQIQDYQQKIQLCKLEIQQKEQQIIQLRIDGYQRDIEIDN